MAERERLREIERIQREAENSRKDAEYQQSKLQNGEHDSGIARRTPSSSSTQSLPVSEVPRVKAIASRFQEIAKAEADIERRNREDAEEKVREAEERKNKFASLMNRWKVHPLPLLYSSFPQHPKCQMNFYILI